MKNIYLHYLMMCAKYSFHSFLAIAILSNSLLANSGEAQNMKSIKDVYIDFQAKDVSIMEAFSEIEKKTDFEIFYRQRDLKNTAKISIDLRHASVREILSEISKQARVSFKQVNNFISVKTHDSGGEPTIDVVLPEKITVTGTVTDENGDPLPAASVIEKGTTNGTVTDTEGNFSIEVEQGVTLQFSFIGYLSQEVEIESQTMLNIKMTPDISGLKEIVVVGYGSMKRSDITGSVASIKTESLQKSAQRIDQALQGRISGVMIQNQSASPRGGINIRIRGANSINGGNDPLIVIDGLQGGSLVTLNPNDIESIEVLKDASATAIYGSRGANGVILVTTKNGKTGKAKVGYDTYFSFQRPMKTLDILNAAQYAEVVNENRIERNQTPVFTDSEIAGFRNSGGTDWQDEILRNGFSQNHSLSVGGGSNHLSYFVSGGFVDTDGIILNTNYQRFNLRSNISARITDKLRLDLRTYLSREEDHPTNLNTYGGTNNGSPVYSALIFAPTKAVYDSDGNYTSPGGGYGPPTNSNPVALALEPIRDHIYNTTNLNGSISYEFIEGLTFAINGSYLLSESILNQYFNSVPSKASGSEEATISNGQSMTLQNTNQITYVKTLDESHEFMLTGVYEQQIIESNNVGTGSRGYFSDATGYNNLGLGATPSSPSSSTAKRTLESYMARINYSYKGKYLLTLTGRADGSSVFGDNNKWGYFPSVAVGWNVSNESFMTGTQDVISNFKVRASYGITGNQAIAPYKSMGLLNTNDSYPLDGSTPYVAAQLGGLANPDLEWEKTAQADLGVDLELFDGRIELIADYYSKQTRDLLLEVPLPSAAGGTARVLRNVGEVENKGFELYIGGKPVNGPFSWETGFTFAKNRNEVVSLKDDEMMYPLGDAGLPGFTNAKWLQVGEPLGLYRGYIQDGVWKASEAADAAVYGAFPGAPKFVDQNTDNIINSEDLVAIADAQPDYTFGWNNTFSFRNFDLNVLVQGVAGNDILNLGRVRMEVTNGDADATSPAILERWSPEDGEKETNVPSFTGFNAFPTLATSRWVEDGSYLRVKYITLGYNLPESIADNLKIESARIYFTGTNLMTVTDYSGFDPEASSGVDRNGGVDVAAYPAQKIYTIGLNLRF